MASTLPIQAQISTSTVGESNGSTTSASSASASASSASASSSAANNNLTPTQLFMQTTIMQKVVGLCIWTNTLHSALTLLCALLITILLQSGYTVLTLFSYLLMLQLLTCFIFINGSQFILKLKGQQVSSTAATATTTADGAQKPAGDFEPVEYVSSATLNSLVTPVQVFVNSALNSAMFIVRCGDNMLTLKVIGVLFILSLLGRMFDGVTLFGLLSIFALSIPKLYQLNQPVADRYLDKSREMINKFWKVMTHKTASLEKQKSS